MNMTLKNNTSYLFNSVKRTFLNAIILLFVICFSGFSCDSKEIQFEYVDPMEKVLAESSFFPGSQEAISEVVRGEHASLQFVVRSPYTINNLRVTVTQASNKDKLLPASKVRFVGFVKVGRSIWDYSRDRINSPSGYFPDPLLEEDEIDVKFGNSQPIWITIPIPSDASPGLYSGKVIINGNIENKEFHIEKDYSVRVYPVTIGKTSLWITNWFTIDAAQLKWMNGGKDFESFSPQHWEYIRKLAKMMAEYRQNSARISPLDLSDFAFINGKWQVDFTRFDKVVEIFIQEGLIGRLEGGHIGTREGNWDSQFVVRVPSVDRNAENRFEKLPLSNERARQFYVDFFTSLKQHLKEKGWESSYFQYIADEPTPTNVHSYVEIARFVKQVYPEIKIIEATHSKDLEDIVDIYVPQLDFMNKDYDFYNNINKNSEGKEAWFYTCLSPKGEYANRFIELPLLKTRYIHWLNFKYNIPGYLHWGLNHWRTDPWDEQTSINYEGGNILPGGDSWIIYPKDDKLLSSIRFEAMRDGIVDYELFKMLEKKDPEAARDIIDKVIYSYTRYDNNIAAFREHRRRLMELLSE